MAVSIYESFWGINLLRTNFFLLFLTILAPSHEFCVHFGVSLLLDERSINLSGAQERLGHFYYKNFLRASK